MMRCRNARRVAFAQLGTVAVLAFAQPIHAQPAQDAPISNFRLIDWGGQTFVNSFFSYERQTQDGAAPSEQRELYSQQGVELWGKGYVYHPNLLDFNARIRVGFTVDDASIGTTSGTSIGELLGYDLSAQVLKEKELTARLYGSMRHEFVGQSFTQPIQLDARTEGVTANYRGDVNASAQFDHVVRTEDSDLRFDDKDSRRVRLTLESAGDRSRTTELAYEHEDVTEDLRFRSPGSDTAFDQNLDESRDEFNATNRWTFGDGALKNRLSGNLRLRHRRGYFNNDVIQVDQRLDLMHSETLSTYYAGSLNYDKTDTQTDRTLRGEAGITKRFFDSLTVTGRFNVLDRRLDDGLEQSIGFYMDIDYHKETPIGRYTTRLTAGRNYEHEQFSGGQRLIENEDLTLTGIDFVSLGSPGVVPGTVTVTDARNAIRYLEGVDYELRQSGRLTEIRRLVGGGINSGDAILVDYLSQAGRNSRFHQDTFIWSHRVDLNFVPAAIYGLYSLRDEALDSGDDPLNLERDERWLFGVEYTLGDLTLSSEVERHNLRLSPGWDAYRARANYAYKLSPQAYLSAAAHYERLEYHDAAEFGLGPGRDFRDSYGINADATAKITPNLLLRLDAIYLRTQGRNNDELIRIGPELMWKSGDMELTIGGYQAFYRQEDTEGQTTYSMLQFKRSF